CARFQSYRRGAGVSYDIVPRLVRGLDYYVRTAFEIVSGELGSQNALAGGGRYDGLSEVLGGPPVAGFGFALGLDRLVMVLPREVEAAATRRPDLFLACLGDAAFHRGMTMARELRRSGYSVLLPFGATSLRSQMRLANRLLARHVVIIGDMELATARYQVKRMEDSSQRELSLPELLD